MNEKHVMIYVEGYMRDEPTDKQFVSVTSIQFLELQAHFDESQFEKNRQDGWKKLRPNAVHV
jgi:hypothetical protein